MSCLVRHLHQADPQLHQAQGKLLTWHGKLRYIDGVLICHRLCYWTVSPV